MRALIAMACACVILAGCQQKASGPIRRVAVTADEQGFHPTDIPARKGEVIELAFTRTTDKTCAKEVEFPSLRKKKALPLNKTVVVRVPAEAVGNVDFACGMKMYAGAVIVE